MQIERLSQKYTVRALGESDVDAIYALSAGNPLFFQYCPPFVTRESILSDMKALPPRTTYDDKHYIGFFQGDSLVAVLDLIERYPNDSTAFIGLFMMDKSRQGQGEGSFIVGQCCEYFKELGYTAVRLGFAQGNPQSEAFWTKNGFRKTGAADKQELYTVIVMEKPLV